MNKEKKKREKLAYNLSELPHVWVHKTQDYAYYKSNANIYFNKDEFYHYDTLVAIRIGEYYIVKEFDYRGSFGNGISTGDISSALPKEMKYFVVDCNLSTDKKILRNNLRKAYIESYVNKYTEQLEFIENNRLRRIYFGATLSITYWESGKYSDRSDTRLQKRWIKKLFNTLEITEEELNSKIHLTRGYWEIYKGWKKVYNSRKIDKYVSLNDVLSNKLLRSIKKKLEDKIFYLSVRHHIDDTLTIPERIKYAIENKDRLKNDNVLSELAIEIRGLINKSNTNENIQKQIEKWEEENIHLYRNYSEVYIESIRQSIKNTIEEIDEKDISGFTESQVRKYNNLKEVFESHIKEDPDSDVRFQKGAFLKVLKDNKEVVITTRGVHVPTKDAESLYKYYVNLRNKDKTIKLNRDSIKVGYYRLHSISKDTDGEYIITVGCHTITAFAIDRFVNKYMPDWKEKYPLSV